MVSKRLGHGAECLDSRRGRLRMPGSASPSPVCASVSSPVEMGRLIESPLLVSVRRKQEHACKASGRKQGTWEALTKS